MNAAHSHEQLASELFGSDDERVDFEQLAREQAWEDQPQPATWTITVVTFRVTC